MGQVYYKNWLNISSKLIPVNKNSFGKYIKINRWFKYIEYEIFPKNWIGFTVKMLLLSSPSTKDKTKSDIIIGVKIVFIKWL